MERRDEFFIECESLPTAFLRDLDVLTGEAHEEVDNPSDCLRVGSLPPITHEEIADHPRGDDVALFQSFSPAREDPLSDFPCQGLVLREFTLDDVTGPLEDLS